MLKDNYDAIVIGTGILGTCCTNLLSQTGFSVLNIGKTNDFGHKESISSLNLQGWLISGTTWCHDPVKDLPVKLFAQSRYILDSLNMPQISPEDSNGLAILNNGQMKKLLEKQNDPTSAMDFPPFLKVDSESTLRDYGLTNLQEDRTYLKIVDTSFPMKTLLDRLEYTSYLNGADIMNIRDPIHLQFNSNTDNKIDVIILGKKMHPQYLFICTGANSFKLLNPLYDNDLHNQIFIDYSLAESNLKPEFQFTLERSPLLQSTNNIGFHGDILVDLVNLFSLLHHKKNHNLVFASGRNDLKIKLDPLVDMYEDLNDKKTSDGLARMIGRYNANLISKSGWHCNRLERSVVDKDNDRKMQTVSNWSGLLPGFNSVIWGVPGKATLSFDTGLNMVNLIDFPKINKLDYQFNIPPRDYPSKNTCLFDQ